MTRDREFGQIQKFTAECRRLWPGAKIVLRPGDLPKLGAPKITEPST
jgi:hypothetical protein